MTAPQTDRITDHRAVAVSAVRAIEWSPALERQVASLLTERVASGDALARVVTPVRAQLDDLSAAVGGAPWRATPMGTAKPSRDAWEVTVWLAYGDAKLLAADGDASAARARVAIAPRLAVRLADAPDAEVGDLVTAFGLAEAGALQAQRLAAIVPPDAAGADAMIEALSPIPDTAWSAALRREAEAVTSRVAAMAADPAAGLGLRRDALPERARTLTPAALLDVAAAQDAAVGLFLAAADRGVGACAAPSTFAQPDPAGPAGDIFLQGLAESLAQIDDRRCLTEAARRAAILAVRLRTNQGLGDGLPEALPDDPALYDPFTNRPFAYDAEAATLRSAGRDRQLSAKPGQGPFDDAEPTWSLELTPLL